MYLWYSKKKGVNVGNPQHKNTVSDQFCVATTGAFWPNVPTFGCRGDISPTCWQLSQPRQSTVVDGGNDSQRGGQLAVMTAIAWAEGGRQGS